MGQSLNLVVLAAGLGSRFGGLKQIAAVDAYGHALIDYAVFDALRAGFGRVVIVTTAALEPEFHARIGARLAAHTDLVYAHQDLEPLPAGFSVPAGREKPWGTAHAVLAAADQVTGPFATINADDFYGADALRAMAGFLAADVAPDHHGLVGYRLDNTLSEHGEVARGICQADAAGHLVGITEHTRVGRSGDRIVTMTDQGALPLDPATIVSLNLWGFHPAVLDEFRAEFPAFLRDDLPANPLRAEFYLPRVPDTLVTSGRAEFSVLATPDRWYGVTYADDLPLVRSAIARLQAEGVYPDHLWE
ncbi:MAG: NTP transferase domain-containing protein [Propionibacteriaceae bacterium]|jgi:hypothetical protein|nr:NTP transferase domain-containing protein [Propionibacteriaceae bacterium]